jgi:diguanylate cyclase (GGDEF)-like protein
MFAWLMLFQWLAGIAAACWISPRTWAGAQSAVHPHVWAALFLGGGISLLPILAALTYPGRSLTRHLIAACQVLMSALLIHLTGGRIETHFHIFGSLAFLAFYRDWRVLLPATLVVGADHLLRELFWPQSVYGVLAASGWRWLEHTGWVLFEDTFLVLAIRQSTREMRNIAERQALQEAAEGALREARDDLEERVQERTATLKETNLHLQQQIVERERAEERIRWQAHHDALTGLPNRTLFLDRLEQALAVARHHQTFAAVLFLDLDHFKQINDSLGHPVGDLLLREVASRLTASLRPEDTVGRIGGDEFLILLPGLPRPEEAANAARTLLNALAQPLHLAGNEVFLTASVGVSLFPSNAGDPESLVKQADIAMYRSKQLGRNDYQLYTQEMNASTLEHFNLEVGLHKALAREELVLFYQPQIHLATGSIVGVEALVRWRHPEMDLVPPTKFIPLAEKTGLILPLGEWVLREAARQALAWRQAGYEVPVSVNLSARQLAQQDLVGMVSSILRETGLPPEWLDIELTESAIMSQGSGVVETLHSLKGLGVRLSVDDFGTGYSSLSYLRRFPLDTLKIDRSFIRGLEANEVDVAIVRAVVDLAHAIGLSVVAEGVETEGQWQALRSLGCDSIQGYLFSRPVPAEQLQTLLAAPTPFV